MNKKKALELIKEVLERELDQTRNKMIIAECKANSPIAWPSDKLDFLNLQKQVKKLEKARNLILEDEEMLNLINKYGIKYIKKAISHKQTDDFEPMRHFRD